MAQRAQPREACRENIEAALYADSAHRIGFAPAVPQRALADVIGGNDREALPRNPMQIEQGLERIFGIRKCRRRIGQPQQARGYLPE
jgi:hypothetical protein